MKLKNKKTGEIVKLVGYVNTSDDRMFFRFEDDKDTYKKEYNSLAELNEEWEDYEEPKYNGYWYIDDLGRIQFSSELLDELEEHPNNWMIRKLFGNYFLSREEAEKAVERLRAWKRLKNYNLKFNLDFVKNKIDFTYSINNPLLDVLDGEEQIFNNMKIVFGGKE